MSPQHLSPGRLQRRLSDGKAAGDDGEVRRRAHRRGGGGFPFAIETDIPVTGRMTNCPSRGEIMPKDIKCVFGVDIDAVGGWLGSYGGEDSPSDIQRGMFSGE